MVIVAVISVWMVIAVVTAIQIVIVAVIAVGMVTVAVTADGYCSSNISRDGYCSSTYSSSVGRKRVSLLKPCACCGCAVSVVRCFSGSAIRYRLISVGMATVAVDMVTVAVVTAVV